MAQEFAVTYPDSAKVLHVHGFKFMLKPVWVRTRVFCWARSPTRSAWSSWSQGRDAARAAETEHRGQVWLWAEGTTDSRIRDTWGQPHLNAELSSSDVLWSSRANRCQRTRNVGTQLELGAVGEGRAPYHLTGHYCKLGQLSSRQFSTERLHNRMGRKMGCATPSWWRWWGHSPALRLMKHHEVSRIVSKKPRIFQNLLYVAPVPNN